MALTITLSEDLEEQLRDIAVDRGESVESLVASVVRQFERLNLLQKISWEFHASIELDELLPTVFKEVIGAMEAEGGSIWLLDPSGQELECRIAAGGGGEKLLGSRLKLGQGLAGWVTLHQQPTTVDDVKRDERWAADVGDAERLEFETTSLISVPLVTKGESLGAINVVNKLESEGFTPDDMELLTGLANNAALAIKNAQLVEELKEAERRQVWKLWEGYWERLNPDQQVILVSIAGGRFTGPGDYELESLKSAGLVYEDRAGRMRLFSEEFGRFILSLSRGREKAAVLAAGQRLDDQYKIQKTVGDTGHSRIVKAWDEKLERVVAIKLLRSDTKLGDRDVQRFRKNLVREAHILAKLRHTHIGQVFTIIQEPLGVVMEWVAGISLRDVIHADEQRTALDIINIGIEMADALSYVHRRDIVHRDIKPGNIILTDDEERNSVLIDFDIARVSSHETISLLEDGSRGYLGTVAYSAPEQFRDPEAVGPSTDVFALGVVLYELLTHQRPYRWGNDPSLYEGGRFPKPERFNMPEPLYQILCKPLSEKPAQRPDAARLREELQNYKLSNISELGQVVVPYSHDPKTGPLSSLYDTTVKTSG
jgi:serine/threonine protein kinase